MKFHIVHANIGINGKFFERRTKTKKKNGRTQTSEHKTQKHWIRMSWKRYLSFFPHIPRYSLFYYLIVLFIVRIFILPLNLVFIKCILYTCVMCIYVCILLGWVSCQNFSKGMKIMRAKIKACDLLLAWSPDSNVKNPFRYLHTMKLFRYFRTIFNICGLVVAPKCAVPKMKIRKKPKTHHPNENFVCVFVCPSPLSPHWK